MPHKSSLGNPKYAGAFLDTRFLSDDMKRTLAVGLEARHDELMRDARTGYTPGASDPRVEKLVAVARQAHALGIIAYLPKWADFRKEDTLERTSRGRTRS